jgi:predicted nucleic acid-binding protein
VVSYQVIQEFVNVASRKFKVPLKSADITDFIDGTFRRMHVVHSSFELFHSALGVQTRYRLSWFDSILVAAGAESGCSVLFSEDLHDGAKFGSLRVANPFGPKAR